MSELELLHAQALLSEAYQGIAPAVERERTVRLQGVAHPLLLLEAHGRGMPLGNDPDEAPYGIVRNDVHLGGDARCLVISGANTGGKTVLLKAVGLCVLLVQHGMHIPARPSTRLDWFTDVWADIGDQQSLEASLSTFSAQIRFMSHWLAEAGPDTLVLLDEMLTGTEPAQGAALAGAVLQALLEKGATAVVTTHFGELKELAAHHPGIVNGAMAFDVEALRPTFRLTVGLPGASFAMHIARRYGLPEALVGQAEAALAERPAAVDTLLAQIYQRQRQLDDAQAHLRQQATRLEEREAALHRKREALSDRERGIQRRERGAVGRELRQARRRIAEVTRELQQANSLQTVQRVQQRLSDLEQELPVAEAAQPRAASAGPADLTALAPDSAVWLPHLGRSAVLETVLDGGRRARVRLGAVTMEVAQEEIAPDQRKPAGKRPHRHEEPAPAVAEASARIAFALSTAENTLDLRGLRLEEALEEAERFLDHCTMKHVSPVMLIHGHGTGRLKIGLREHLQDSRYTAAFRPGEAGEGGDGVTIVALNL